MITKNGGQYEFQSTGRIVYANDLIIGIAPDDQVVYEGYDGEIDDPRRDWDPDYVQLTKEEKIELADYMITLWGDYKEKAEKREKEAKPIENPEGGQ